MLLDLTALGGPTVIFLFVAAIVGFLALVLSACAGRPGPEVLTPVTAAVPGARMVTVYVATTRERISPGRNVFTTDRAAGLNYAD